MSIWIHWIGLKYYTIDSFILEAEKLGVSRRIPPQILKSMSWGDRIYLIGEIPEMPKRGILFGYFIVDKIKYVTKDKKLSKKMKKLLEDKSEIVYCGKKAGVERGCGYEEYGGFYLVTEASVKEIANVLVRGKSTVNVVSQLYLLKKAKLTNIKPFRGFKHVSIEKISKLLGYSKDIDLKKTRVDISELIKRYFKLNKKGDKKSLKRFRKSLKSRGVWDQMKKKVMKKKGDN